MSRPTSAYVAASGPHMRPEFGNADYQNFQDTCSYDTLTYIQLFR